MVRKRLFEFFLFFNLISNILPGPLQRWTFELIEIKTFTNNPNLVDLGGEVIRLGRADFGFNGFWDLKIDLYDDLLVRVTFERSLHRDGPYHMTPFSIENETLSSGMNKYYKPLVQSTAEKCCKDPPMVKHRFVPPLTKRHVIMTNCSFSTDNMPSVMPTGYQRMRITLFGPFEMYVESIAYIENKIL